MEIASQVFKLMFRQLTFHIFKQPSLIPRLEIERKGKDRNFPLKLMLRQFQFYISTTVRHSSPGNRERKRKAKENSLKLVFRQSLRCILNVSPSLFTWKQKEKNINPCLLPVELMFRQLLFYNLNNSPSYLMPVKSSS